jgi:S1-C subfamily serine protease
VNTQGEVVGLNTMGALFGGDLGFALPSAMIRHLMPQLREFGRVNWSWTGLLLQPLKDFERNIYFEANEGCMVAGTDPDSPAAAAGIQPRDRIVSLNGEPFDGVTEEDLPALRLRLALLPKGKPAVLALVRDGKPQTVEVTPREKGKVEGDELACPRWDFTVKTINQFDNPTLHFVRQKGVFIFGVKYPGNAASAGLQHNDILTRIGDREVTTLDDVREAHRQAMAELGVKTRTVISVLRNGLMRQFVLDYARDYEKE